MTDARYDQFIVCRVTAGSVLANRLTADDRSRVLLIEAGGPAHNHWLHIPLLHGRS